MSNFFKTTKHPVTGKFEEAIWLDGFFGGRRYGVQFPNGDIFNAESYKFETKESRSKKEQGSVKSCEFNRKIAKMLWPEAQIVCRNDGAVRCIGNSQWYDWNSRSVWAVKIKEKKKSRAVDKNTEEDRRLHFLPDIKNGA